jgi:hypothetical protein
MHGTETAAQLLPDKRKNSVMALNLLHCHFLHLQQEMCHPTRILTAFVLFCDKK